MPASIFPREFNPLLFYLSLVHNFDFTFAFLIGVTATYYYIWHIAPPHVPRLMSQYMSEILIASILGLERNHRSGYLHGIPNKSALLRYAVVLRLLRGYGTVVLRVLRSYGTVVLRVLRGYGTAWGGRANTAHNALLRCYDIKQLRHYGVYQERFKFSLNLLTFKMCLKLHNCIV